MKQAEIAKDENGGVTAEQVQTYLSQHPGFFANHEGLLQNLSIPHHSGSAVSLIEKQLQLYREKNEKLSQQLSLLVQIARENDGLFQKVHKLTLSLMDASDLENTVTDLQSVLHNEFKADFVSLRILQENSDSPLAEVFVAPSDPRLDSFQKMIDSGRPKCGEPASEHGAFLFGDNGDRIKSCAIIPFATSGVSGLLGIGSLDGERFLPTMGQLFLIQIGELIAYRLNAILGSES
ncbi:MAG: DUF484 family protein [Methylococcales bacterium]|nr:DUF484 family protein [Methylococcales bacterium]